MRDEPLHAGGLVYGPYGERQPKRVGGCHSWRAGILDGAEPAVAAGGLISYGPSLIDQFRRAASYVDRILKGEKPGDIPVKNASGTDLFVNTKAAAAMGVTIPQDLVSKAKKVIN